VKTYQKAIDSVAFIVPMFRHIHNMVDLRRISEHCTRATTFLTVQLGEISYVLIPACSSLLMGLIVHIEQF